MKKFIEIVSVIVICLFPVLGVVVLTVTLYTRVAVDITKLARKHMNGRDILPAHRNSETFDVIFNNHFFTVTAGFYQDGRLGEIFINGGKSGQDMEAVARDGAVLLSLALQHGVTLDTIKHAITRDSQGLASSIVGAVVDQLCA